MTLAYVFWHWPLRRVDPAVYERHLLAFQAALGRPGTQTYRLDRAPWDGARRGPVYEDWYPVRDWGDLGALNDEAVSGRNRPPHDVVAHEAHDGAGGVYRLLRGEHPAGATDATWLAKPPGMAYEELLAELPAGATVWQRQLVLGPAPELLVLGEAPLSLPWPSIRLARTPL